MGIELLAALAVGAAIGFAALYIVRARAATPADARISRLAERPRDEQRGLAWSEIRRRGPSNLPWLSRMLTESDWARRQTLEIEQAGLGLRVGEYLMIRVGFALVTFALIWLFGRNTVAFVIAIVCGLFAFMLPAVWISIVRSRRIARINKQLVEAIGMIAGALRAGFAFQHGLDMVAKQMSAPVSEEFARIIVDLNLGASIEDALRGFLARVDTEDVNMVVTAVLIQRQSGGNLAEILETVAETMRERDRITGEVRTMTAQQRFSGTVLTLWPMLLLGVFALANWGQTKLLFTTDAGLTLLAIGFVLQLLGYFSIRRILDIDI